MIVSDAKVIVLSGRMPPVRTGIPVKDTPYKGKETEGNFKALISGSICQNSGKYVLELGRLFRQSIVACDTGLIDGFVTHLNLLVRKFDNELEEELQCMLGYNLYLLLIRVGELLTGRKDIPKDKFSQFPEIYEYQAISLKKSLFVCCALVHAFEKLKWRAGRVEFLSFFNDAVQFPVLGRCMQRALGVLDWESSFDSWQRIRLCDFDQRSLMLDEMMGSLRLADDVLPALRSKLRDQDWAFLNGTSLGYRALYFLSKLSSWGCRSASVVLKSMPPYLIENLVPWANDNQGEAILLVEVIRAERMRLESGAND